MSKKAEAPATGTTATRQTKKIVALTHLLNRSLIQPEAHKRYGETCLHSTISNFANDHGLTFIRVPERYGKYDALFTRYKLTSDSREHAFKLLEYLKQLKVEG